MNYNTKDGKTMSRFTHDILLRLVKIINILVMTLIFAGCWYWCYSKEMMVPFYKKGNGLMIFIFLILYMMFGRIYDAFLISLKKISEIEFSQCLACFLSDGFMYMIMILLKQNLPSILPFLVMFLIQIIWSCIWCRVIQKWYFVTFPAQKTAVIYDVRNGMKKLIKEYGLEKRFDIKELLNVKTCLANDCEILNRVQVVFLCGIHSHDRNVILKKCVQKGVVVYVLPRVGDTIMNGAVRMQLFHLPILRVARYAPTPEYVLLKRLFDVVSSFFVLCAFSPIMLITAFIIKLTDGGPVFYRQRRLTINGKVFNILKFRSMRVDAEKDGIARLSTGENDERITPIGRIIRRFRIDEIPQLVNILRGDMSVVGPRPERPEVAAEYEKELPEFALRLQVKSGLTGYAQVYGKYNTIPYDKLLMDLMYISKPSFITDLAIIFSTIKILFMRDSTEGVIENQITATQNVMEVRK